MTLLLACIFSLTASISTILADETSDAMQALQTAIEKEAAQQKPIEPMDAEGRGEAMSAMFLGQLRSALSQGETPQLDDILNQVPIYLKSDAVRQAVDKLRAALNTERATREQAVSARVETGIAAAANAVQGAKKAADLDKTLTDLGHLQEQSQEGNSEKARARMEKIRNTRQFVLRWQDYLADLETGDSQAAVQTLRNIENQDSFDVIPRSEIIARIAELSKSTPAETTRKPPETPAQKIREILEKTKSLDAIPAALDSLTHLQRDPGWQNNGWNDPITASKNELSGIFQAYSNYKAGMPGQFTLSGNNDTLPLRAELIRLVAPRFLDLDEKSKPVENETIQAYLDRMMTMARQTADARLIARVLELQDMLGGKQSDAASTAFLKPLLAAQNQEIAGQFPPAVVSYEVALKSGGEFVPAEAIGAHLEAIKKAHPEEYQQGMQLFLGGQATAPEQPIYNSFQQAPHPVTIPGSLLGKSISSPPPAPAHTP